MKEIITRKANDAEWTVSEVTWPEYSLDNPEIIVFNANVSHLGYVEPDLYRAEALKYMGDRLDTVFGH